MRKIIDLDRNELRKFGVTTGLVVALLFGLALPWLLGFPFPIWPWIVFAILASWGLIAPMSLQPVHRTWMKFGLFMSRFTTPLILGLTFFIAIVPMGLLIRLFGHDALKLKVDRSADSYKIHSEKKTRDTLENPY